MLMSYHWPGNVRELENCIERAVLVCEGGVIHAHHLPPTLQTAEVSGTLPRASLEAAVGAYEKDLILDALKTARGNRAKAARLLDTDRADHRLQDPQVRDRPRSASGPEPRPDTFRRTPASPATFRRRRQATSAGHRPQSVCRRQCARDQDARQRGRGCARFLLTPAAGGFVEEVRYDRAPTSRGCWSSTALVLLMTPALGFFYGGLVRSKNALNTLMMSVAALGLRGRGLGAARLLAGLRAGHAAGRRPLKFAFLRGVGLEAQGTIPHLLFMAYQGTFAIITAALDLGRDRRAHALRRRTSPSSRCGASSSTRPSRTGSGAAAGSPRWARSTSRAARSCTSTPARPRWWRRWCWGRARTTRGRRSCRTTSPFTRARRGPALVRLVRLQRRQRAGRQRVAALAFVNTHARPGRDARRLDAARPRAHRQGDRGGRRHRHRGRPGRHHAGGRLRGPAWPPWPWAPSPRSPATSRCSGARARASTTRSTWWPRTAWAARWARCSPASWPARPGTASADGLLFGNPRQLGIQAVARAGRDRLQRASGPFVHPEADRRSSRRSARDAREEGLGLDVSQHGEEAYARGEGAILVLPRADVDARPQRRPARRRAGAGRPRMKLVVAIVRPEKLAGRPRGAVPRRGARASPSAACRATAARPSRSRPTAAPR